MVMPEHQVFQGQEESALLSGGSPVGDPGRKGWDLFRPLGPSLVYQAYRGRVRGAGSYILSFQSSPWVSRAMSRTGVCGPLSLGLFFCGGRHSWRCGWCGRWCRQNSDTWGRGYTHVCTRICTRGPVQSCWCTSQGVGLALCIAASHRRLLRFLHPNPVFRMTSDMYLQGRKIAHVLSDSVLS